MKNTLQFDHLTLSVVAVACLSLVISAGNMATGQQSGQIRYSGHEQPPLIDRQREIALALSACPQSVAGKAAVYVLEKSGYVKVRESQNGFTAIVGHALPNSVDPQCMNEEATRTHLPPQLKLAELRAQGKSSAEIKRIMAEGYANGSFPKPTGVAIDYMLSKENFVPNFKGGVSPYPPHVMFFVPGITNAELGGDVTLGPDGNPHAPAFVVNEGTAQAIIIVTAESVTTENRAGQGPGAEHNHSAGAQ